MSGGISATSGGYATLAEAIASSAKLMNRFNTLTGQASSGYLSQSFAGLGDTAATALTLGPEISGLRTAQTNIGAALGPVQVTQNAMTQIQSIASNLLAQMPNLNGLSPAQIDSVAAGARSDLQQVADLLDSQYAGTYVFSGQDTSNPPVPNPDQVTSSGFFTQISAAVGGLAANGASATAAATLLIASSNMPGTSPFSTYMSQATPTLPSVSTGDGHSQTIGLLASRNTSAVSAGGSTTGSYMRDLMRALATIGSLNSSQIKTAGFAGLVSDTQTSVTNLITAMSADVGDLGEKQANLTSIQTNLSDTQTALNGQLSITQDVNMTETLSNLTLMQTQLQASYQLITASSGMSLVKFLPAGA